MGIIMGDPAGIGPEITIKSILSPEIQPLCTPVVIGDARIVGLIIGTSLVVATIGHGTAFEIAGKGIANPGPMTEAIKLVAQSSSL